MGCGVDGNRVYLVGGCDWDEEAEETEPLDFVECFDAATGELRSNSLWPPDVERCRTCQ